MRLRLASLVSAFVLPAALSAQVSVDGQLGSEWTGISSVLVNYNASALNGNFGTPSNINTPTGYEIYLRRDANWVYAALRTTTPGGTGGALTFANLYFSALSGPGQYGTAGSSIGFEVTNDRAFKPGVGGYFNDTPSNFIRYATSAAAGQPEVVEVAFDLSVFTGNALGVTGYDPTAAHTLRLNLSQSFGYSVAGGQASYGDARLGTVSLAPSVVPEPSTYVLMAAGLAGLFVARRRRRI